MAKINYQFDKRQRDLAKKKKQDDKRAKKLAKKTAATSPEDSSATPQDETL
ncbi:MAG: hypothetical protein ACRER0_01945 [Gammaproteobacteria bacterium]